jgi:hypothetical protein
VKPLADVLSALLGRAAIENDMSILMATDARAARAIKAAGILYSDAMRDEIDALANPGPCSADAVRAAYYFGLQIGWRAAQRMR